MDPKLLDRIIQIRRELHQNPEVSMKQFETTQRIHKYLTEFGIKPESIRRYQPTGLSIDIKGEAEPLGQDYCIALRADIDALSMLEQTTNLPYSSKNKEAAHMCGHDGHTACLIGFVPLYLKELKNVPKNKTLRLFFQMSEEGPISGADEMIKQGCLQGVKQVYGCHNWPIDLPGKLWCKEGPVMSQISIIKVKIIGQGGHGSEPQKIKVAIWKAMEFYMKVKTFIDQLKKERPQQFVCTIPVFQSGERYNVISDSAYMEGTIRSFTTGLNKLIFNKIEEQLQSVKKEGFVCDFQYTVNCPVNSNTKAEAEHVLRVAKEHFGEQNVGKGSLPFYASEDYAFFTQKCPGAFFFLSSSKTKENQPFLHNSFFDFNDDVIEKASTFWLKLALDRLK